MIYIVHQLNGRIMTEIKLNFNSKYFFTFEMHLVRLIRRGEEMDEVSGWLFIFLH